MELAICISGHIRLTLSGRQSWPLGSLIADWNLAEPLNVLARADAAGRGAGLERARSGALGGGRCSEDPLGDAAAAGVQPPAEHPLPVELRGRTGPGTWAEMGGTLPGDRG